LEKKPERRYQSAIELANAFCLAIAASDMEETQDSRSGPVPVAPVPRTASERITPLIVQPPQAPILPEMPPITSLSKVVSSRPIESRPIERTQKQRRRRASPASQRAVVVTILALVILLVLAIPTFLVATHRLNPNNAFATTPVQTATTPAATQGTTSASITTTATPDLTATAQAAASATAQAQDQATVTAQAAASATAQAQGQATATVQAVASATAQAQDQATATVVAGVTATAQAQAQATAGIVQTATAGTPTYQDPLTDATNPDTVAANWDKNNHCTFMSDGYHVTEPVGIVNLHGCRESANMYGNLAISVDVSIISGHSGGVFFRVSTDVFNNYMGYLFEINSQGEYKISGFNGSRQPLHDWTASSALKQGNNVTNTLLAVAQGGKLLFYANGVFLTEVDDSTYTSGVIAFLATTTDTNADVVYSNLKVYQLP
jgi:eukaryotic-like serine/threonine-protein kinase